MSNFTLTSKNVSYLDIILTQLAHFDICKIACSQKKAKQKIENSQVTRLPGQLTSAQTLGNLCLNLRSSTTSLLPATALLPPACLPRPKHYSGDERMSWFGIEREY